MQQENCAIMAGRSLWLRRERLALSIPEIAKLSDLSTHEVSQIETGQVDDAQLRSALELVIESREAHSDFFGLNHPMCDSGKIIKILK